MTKKKTLFSKFKAKLFSSKKTEELSDDDDYENTYHLEDEDSEFAEATDDEILEALEAAEESQIDQEYLEEDDEDEVFEASPMKLSEEEKAKVDEEIPDFPEVEQLRPEPTREIDLNQMRFSEEQFDGFSDEEQVQISEMPLKKTSLKVRSMQIVKSLYRKIKERRTAAMLKKSPNKASGSFDWDNIYNQIFSPESRPSIHRGFLALLFVFITYGAGKMIALSLKGTQLQTRASSSRPVPVIVYRARPEMNTVAKVDLFNAPGNVEDTKNPIEKKIEKKVDENIICSTADKESQLSIKLINTLVLQDSIKSIAAVQIRNANEVLNIREGEKINDMAKIGRIDRQKVIFKNLSTGQCEYIANVDAKLNRMKPLQILQPSQGKKLIKSQTKEGIVNTAHSYKIPTKVRDSMLANISEILTQARAVQITNPDGSFSFKMTEIVPDSLYSKLGIENGDIVKTINGKRIKNINEVMSLFGNIRQIDHFELGIERNGADVNKEYDFQ